MPSHMPKKVWANRSCARISVNSIHEVLVSAREHSTRFMVRGEGCVHIAATYTGGCNMLGTMAVRWIHAMFVTGLNAVVRRDRAAAWALNSPLVRDNQYDPDVPLETGSIHALMYENGNFMAKFAGYPGCHKY